MKIYYKFWQLFEDVATFGSVWIYTPICDNICIIMCNSLTQIHLRLNMWMKIFSQKTDLKFFQSSKQCDGQTMQLLWQLAQKYPVFSQNSCTICIITYSSKYPVDPYPLQKLHCFLFSNNHCSNVCSVLILAALIAMTFAVCQLYSQS